MHRIASYRINKNLWSRYTCFLATLGNGFFIACLFSSSAAAQNLNVTVDTALNSGTYIYSDVVITNGAKLILNGNVTLSANNVTVDLGAVITADGKGHLGGQGPGAGAVKITGGSGGGYGGAGGTTPILPAQVGGIYGSATKLGELGSGGGGFVCSFSTGPVYSGGAGGGSIRLEISGVLTVNGSITSNGGATITACDGRSGGGSGGSIYITTDSIAGTGSISAKGAPGGPSRGGGGGGGRIAVYYKNWNFLGMIDASGGFGLTEAGVNGSGKKGTIGFFDVINNDFYAGSSWRFQENDSPFELNKVTLNGSVVETEKNILVSAALMILNNGSMLLTNEKVSFSVQDVLVSGNSTIEGNLKISAVNFTLAQGSKVSANAKGYSGGQGLGSGLASQFGGSGGGYGGRGGAGGLISSGGLPYGSPTAPVDFGSGGDGPGFTMNNVFFPSSGGPGGGKIQLTVANTLTVDGVISANGGNALERQSGGGAGGSIYIITEKFAGSGSITANGGQSGPTGGSAAGGGGGGGRVAIFHRQPSTFTGSITSLGGLGVGHNGENGSVVIAQDQLAIYPNRGGDTGSVTVTISGSVFVDGSMVRLVRGGQADIAGDSLKLSDNGIKLTATFNLTGQTRGGWDLVVTHPDGSTISLPNGFTIEEGRAPELWVDIIGLNQIRLGREHRYFIVYGNKGNTDSFDVPLLLSGIFSNVNVEFKFEPHIPEQIEGQAPINWEEIPKFIEISNETLIPLLLRRIPAGFTGTFEISVKSFSPDTFQLQAEINPPFFQSPLNPHVVQCLTDVFFSLLQITPVVDCAVTGVAGLRELEVEEGGEITKDNVRIWTWETFKVIKQCAGEIFPPAEIIDMATDVVELSFIATSDACLKTYSVLDEIIYEIRTAFSSDPNAKIGSSGTGINRFVAGKEPLRYSIFFENIETATAPAQEVIITDQLDPDKMNLSTFGLGPIAFGDKLVIPPSGLKEYITEVDLRPANNLVVRIEARLDMATGIVTWQFLSLDPQTKRFTSDPLAGFLPPNVNPPEGDGSVVFTVMPKEGLPTGTSILNKAAIVFDVNDPIETSEWVNLLDNTQPQSAVSFLPSTQQLRNFEVSWSGTDEGAGIRGYTIFVSEDDGPFTIWQENTTNASAIFTGEDGKTYTFYSVARDLVGNIEDAPLFGDTATKVSANTAPQAIDDTYNVDEDGNLIIPAGQGVLANDRDNEGNALTGTLINGPAYGTLTFNANGSFDYQPSANFFGTNSFTYKANDGLLDSNVATVTIQVNSVNDIPHADAGEDQTLECRGHSGTIVVLDGSASSDIEGDSLTYIWTGPFPEGNGTITGVNPVITLPLGTHTIVLTVDDGNGGTGTDEALITIEDTLPPAITAQWVPLDVKGDKGEFRVEFSVEDICDPAPEVTGVIETPSLEGLELKLKRDHEIKIKFDLKKRKVEIQGPAPNALLNQLRTYGGIVIENGQQVKVDIKDEDKKQNYELKDGRFKIKAPLAVLKVTSEDSSGNRAEVRVSPDIRDKNHEHGREYM